MSHNLACGIHSLTIGSIWTGKCGRRADCQTIIFPDIITNLRLNSSSIVFLFACFEMRKGFSTIQEHLLILNLFALKHNYLKAGDTQIIYWFFGKIRSLAQLVDMLANYRFFHGCTGAERLKGKWAVTVTLNFEMT